MNLQECFMLEDMFPKSFTDYEERPYGNLFYNTTNNFVGYRPVGVEPIVSKAAAKMIQNEQIITKWAPSLLKMELDNLLWKDDNHIQVKKLWEYLTTYCYLPRLANFSVLENAIRAGVASDEAFAIASSISDDRYSGLKYNTSIMDVYPSDYLVKVLNALKQLNQEKQEEHTYGK